ncbi:MAG: hypothetical protein M1484_00315 [Patescibacteria group bacterium]|nr:hypothetical protein [Patescibacteria group bacterium]MCL5431524.1 hypothetical protein [Patescibacteria group bacterium]
MTVVVKKTPLAIVLIVILGLVAGYFLRQLWTGTTIIDAATHPDWPTFVSTKYHYQIQYPPDWTAQEKAPGDNEKQEVVFLSPDKISCQLTLLKSSQKVDQVEFKTAKNILLQWKFGAKVSSLSAVKYTFVKTNGVESDLYWQAGSQIFRYVYSSDTCLKPLATWQTAM